MRMVEMVRMVEMAGGLLLNTVLMTIDNRKAIDVVDILSTFQVSQAISPTIHGQQSLA